MADKWQTVPIGEIAEIFDGPHATPSKIDFGPIFLGISNLAQGRLDLANTEHLSEEDYGRWTRRVTPMAGDVVFSYETRLGEAALIPSNLRCCLGRRMGLLRAKPKKVDTRFLLYAYLSPQFQETLRSRAIHGSTVDRIPLIEMPEFPIEIPASIDEQRSIAQILGALDDKIELNHRMNETLEATARTLFKSWFVDFEPVRTRARSRKCGLANSFADKFPNSFDHSELGEIPKGWKACTWGDLITLEYGKALDDYQGQTGAYPVYGTNGRIGTHSRPICPHPGVIVGRKGAYRGIHYCNSPFFVIDTAFYLSPRVPLELRWAYYELLLQDINGMDSGSAIPSTSRGDFYGIPVVVPPVDLQRLFVKLLNPVWLRQEACNNASETLALLRDTLLPKLISGEVRVKDAERLVGTHV